MSAHTPGPWSMFQFEFLEGEELEVQRHRHPDWWEVISNPDKDYRCMCVSGHIGEANARLIAAAPDLLEALEFALPYIEDDAAVQGIDPDEDEATIKARAAIAKAKGKTQ